MGADARDWAERVETGPARAQAAGRMSRSEADQLHRR